MKIIKQKKISNQSQTDNKSGARLAFTKYLYRLRRRSRYSQKVIELLKQDAEARAVRLAAAASLKPFVGTNAALAPVMAASPVASPDQTDGLAPVAAVPSMQRNFYRQPTVRKQYLEFRPSYHRSPQV